MPSNGKYLCTSYDFVWKGPGGTCPGGRACTDAGNVRYMGTRWRPGRKGKRTRAWDSRIERRARQKHLTYMDGGKEIIVGNYKKRGSRPSF